MANPEDMRQIVGDGGDNGDRETVISPVISATAAPATSDEDVGSTEKIVVRRRDDTARLSVGHREYLLQRHGTLDLEPVPDMNDADPYNWPAWKKVTNLSLVAFHAMMATFSAASIQSAFEDIAIELGVSIQTVSYLVSVPIAIIGVAPLLWRPISDRYGRRPIFIVSLICSLVANIGCANSPSYSTMSLCRAIMAFFICPAAAIGSAVVTETFFKKDRARYMGIWTLMVTLGVPLAPFLMGFVAYRVGYRWIYYILACTNAVQLLLYLPFGPETLYVRSEKPFSSVSDEITSKSTTLRREYLNFRRIDPTALRVYDFIHPLSLVLQPCVVIPAVSYSMIFLLANIIISIEIPQLFVAAFGFNTEQIGLQYLALIVGSVIGEQLGGAASDKWMLFRQRRSARNGGSTEAGARPPHEFRLWLAYPGFLLAIIGVVVFLVQTDNAGTGWNITPLIGAGIASAGNQVVTTIMTTYAVDCYREDAASVGVFINFVRQIWGFIGPFWFPPLIISIGLAGSAGVSTALMVGVSVVPTIILQWQGGKWRGLYKSSV